MQAELRSRPLLILLALAAAGTLPGCAPGERTASAETLGACLRTIQRAELALQVAREDLPATDYAEASRSLVAARYSLLSAWARHEGLVISPDDFAAERRRALAFSEGILVEAGLGEQAKLSTLSNAADHPERWREQYDAALICSDGVTP